MPKIQIFIFHFSKANYLWKIVDIYREQNKYIYTQHFACFAVRLRALREPFLSLFILDSYLKRIHYFSNFLKNGMLGFDGVAHNYNVGSGFKPVRSRFGSFDAAANNQRN